MRYRTEREDLRNDFTTSYWLREAVEALDERDPMDALHDARRLLALQEKRVRELISSRPSEADDPDPLDPRSWAHFDMKGRT